MRPGMSLGSGVGFAKGLQFGSDLRWANCFRDSWFWDFWFRLVGFGKGFQFRGFVSWEFSLTGFAICVVAGLLKTVAENKDLKKRKMTETVTDSYVWGASSHSVSQHILMDFFNRSPCG
ncbi:hypothetical protein DY000_02059050 [Brassica cretica]|uniref:Uncharacterized protein n=1 Tax=Brassica cretica TaxID=69181 RepID=A0ABQ7B173_BRACR|nr:hypothetical protein DY000_02059050 [Brassica cretica]